MDKIFTKEVKIALVAIVGIVALFFGLNFLKGINLFSDDETYVMEFKNVAGLSGSCPIYADGYRVGTVNGIDYDYESQGKILVEVGIDKGLRIPLGSTAEISSDLMGNTQVNLLLANNPRQRINPGEIIMGAIDEGAMGQVKAMIPAIEKMLPKLDSIMASLNILLADPAIANTLHNAEGITSNLVTSTAELNKMMASVNKMMNTTVPSVMGKADNVMANTERLTANLATVDVAGTMAKVDATLANVEQMTRAINDRQGTIGKFIYDPSLYNNLNATMRDADSLMIDLKAHPKRYVHFSVFGKKDK